MGITRDCIQAFLGGVKGRRMRARRVLSEVVSILNSAQIPFWLTSGTLLGWFREGDFISNDPDIDLGIHLSDYSHLLPSLFQNAGFRLGFRGTQKEGMELSVAKGPFGKHGETKVDLFFFMPHPQGGRWHAIWPKKGRLGYRYEEFSVEKKSFCGIEVGVPSNPEGYIENQYGTDWRTPDALWAWDKSPFNLFVPPPPLWKESGWKEVVTVIQSSGGASMEQQVNLARTPFVLHLPLGTRLRERSGVDGMIEGLEASGWDLVGGNIQRKGRHTLLEGLLEEKEGKIVWQEGHRGSWKGWSRHDIVPPFFLARTEAVAKVGWDQHLREMHHLDFFLRARGKLRVGKAQEWVADSNQPVPKGRRGESLEFFEKKKLIPLEGWDEWGGIW